VSYKLGANIFENSEFFLQPVPSKRRFQVVIMATGAFAVPSMRVLCGADQFDIVCLVTGPLRYDKNGKPIITPAREVAAEYNLPISEQESVNSTEFFELLYLMRPDLIFVCDFGQILSKRTLTGSILGGINLHSSLLPRFRGAAPVHWAILTGEHYTGVSIIHMTPQIDAGPVIAQSPPIPISPYETVVELEERLAHYGAELVFNTVLKMSRDEMIRIIEQLHDRASKAPRLTKEDGFVPWDQSSRDIFNHYRATIPWPRAFTDWHRNDGSVLRLIVGKMTPLDDSLEELLYEDFSQAIFVEPILTDAKMDNLAELRATPKKKSAKQKRRSPHPQRPAWWKPGVVITAETGILIVAAQEGAVRIEQIQPAGKKMMPIHDFLRGYPIKQGDRFGTINGP
jgi:methionyl-tRNA formyltransferase